MRGFYLFLGFGLLAVISFLGEANAAKLGNYIVYMGGLRSREGDHAQLLTLLKGRKKDSVLQIYRNGFLGFAARLSEAEAKSMEESPGVVSVFPDPILQLHTTRSWDFLKYQTALKTDANIISPAASADTIVGILDTGIWPESKSFTDHGMSPVPSRWKGTCMAGDNFTSSTCNRKLIGARYYTGTSSSKRTPIPMGTPRDDVGHGTHVASTASGRPVSGASYYGLANGTAFGGSTESRIAMYRVCTASGGCLGSAILKGFDDAIADGVDVLSLSLGSSPGEPNFVSDPIAIGAFHAVEKGIAVVCSAGNSGPAPKTVVNVAPWILTVAATTIDRDFETRVVLAKAGVVKGGGINLSGLNKSAVYPLVDGSSVRSASGRASDASVDEKFHRMHGTFCSNCILGSLDGSKVKGKIVLCKNEDRLYGTKSKYTMLKSQGAIGMILTDNNQRQVPSKYGIAPIAIVNQKDGDRILSYINSTSNPMATILPTVVRHNYKPAPVVAYFSSRGPTYGINNLLKPDIAAPGVAILAAWPSNDKKEAIPDKDPPLFDILSGTSMACPHVSGLVAFVKSQYPTWSPSAIRSAIMTTAIQTNNLHAPITTHTESRATPYDIGAGEISLSGPLKPGLVYETNTTDYILFLCNFGYDASQIKRISLTVSNNFSCPTNSDPDLISAMNYPSIAISNLIPDESKTVNRTVTNVGEEESTYTATLEAPDILKVEVIPNKLEFTKNVKILSFQVKFTVTGPSQEDLFGSFTWSSEKYRHTKKPGTRTSGGIATVVWCVEVSSVVVIGLCGRGGRSSAVVWLAVAVGGILHELTSGTSSI
ncbi:subtilisin-like serine endopeptidase family protein [Striga asiatica]|uniref:Subtilisin-like serine endopeptidase family protein n=1 Tax=Striga asiatica TaxID=4170 RepID=A0A5A7PCH7_STRAF|nr:subtilisin-like serine endopeptidase family protein [Striga asiatica]